MTLLELISQWCSTHNMICISKIWDVLKDTISCCTREESHPISELLVVLFVLVIKVIFCIDIYFQGNGDKQLNYLKCAKKFFVKNYRFSLRIDWFCSGFLLLEWKRETINNEFKHAHSLAHQQCICIREEWIEKVIEGLVCQQILALNYICIALTLTKVIIKVECLERFILRTSKVC